MSRDLGACPGELCPRATEKSTPPRARAPQRPEQLFDTHPETSLDFELVRAAARDRYTRPFLLIDSRIIREKTRRFVAAMPRVRPHYAVKANPDPRVLRVLIEEGAGSRSHPPRSSISSLGLGVPAAQVFYSNPMKSREWIGYAAAKGVEWFVVDAVEELRKVHAVRPEAKLYLRIDTPNIGADWPLAGKFGAHAAEIPEIVATAAALGANLAGVTFHVGSQCRNPENWRVGIEKARAVFDQMIAAGLTPAPPQHRRRLPGPAREADPVDRGHRRGGEPGARGVSRRRSR